MKNIKSLLLKTLGLLFALFAVFAVSTTFLAAASYPTKPGRLIVPFEPGGSSDMVGRLIATKLSERFGKQFLVENRSGAGGIIGTEWVAKADPDGYTLLFISGPFTVQAALQKLPYDPIKSFTPIAKLGGGPYSFVVHPSVPANSVKEFIALAKQKPDQLIFGAPGVGTPPHMAAELFKMMTDIDAKIVQFKGTGPTLISLLGGHSHAMISTTVPVLAHIKSGKLRVLGTGGVKRLDVLPDVPTIAEAGVPGYEATGWWGILAPSGTPAPIVDRLSSEIKAILTLDEIKKWFLNEGAELGYLGSTEFKTFLAEDISTWVRVIKKANIKVD
jgi:tripartite-type tricarboxylate transporter receptor subunit TctC